MIVTSSIDNCFGRNSEMILSCAISFSARSTLPWELKIVALSFLCFTNFCSKAISSSCVGLDFAPDFVSKSIIADLIALKDSNRNESFDFMDEIISFSILLFKLII